MKSKQIYPTGPADETSPQQHDAAAETVSQEPIKPLSLTNLAKEFPTIISRGPGGRSNFTATFPQYTPKLHRLLAHFGHNLDTKGIRTKIKELDAQYQTLQARITESNPRRKKDALKVAHGSYLQDSNEANYELMKAAHYDPVQSQREFQTLKNVIANFAEREVKPVFLPLLMEAYKKLIDELPGLRLVDEQLCADFEIPFTPGLTLQMLEAACYRLRSQMQAMGTVPNLRPSELARELGIRLDEPKQS